MAITVDNIITKCNRLRRNWGTRHLKFKAWYDVLTLKDELEQEGMESVVSNDPRAGYNLALHLLTSSIIAHRISSEELEPIQVTGASYLESYVTKRWTQIEKSYRKRGRQSWMRDLISLMLATGWYSVLALVDDDNLIAEVWHPAEVFSEFGADGQTECAHIYPLSAAAANMKARTMGWKLRSPFVSPTTLYDHWGFDADGEVANAIVMGREFVKEATKEPDLEFIPIFTSPVGGLPDKGSLTTGSKWQEHYGESIIATDEGIIANFNKMLTYGQQLVRDTANPRWFEQSRGDTPILTQADLFKRGAIFRGTPEENITPLPTPPIPIELRSILFDYQNMMQRGLFPWSLYGNIQQQITGYAMSQVASAAMQVLTPYHEAVKGLLSDIDNFWLGQMRKHGYKPHGFKMPEDMPSDLEFDVTFNIDIPGYLIQRVTVARMVNPQFRLSTSTTMDKLFPEIKDSLREQARARRDDALNHPIAITISLISAYKEEARLLRDAGDPDTAALYEKAAGALEAQLTPAAPEAAPPGAREIATPREAMPREEVTPPPPMGEMI